MKKTISALAICGIILITGCSDSSEVTADGNSVSLPEAGITIDFPEEYNVFTGEEIYKSIADELSPDDSDTAQELIEYMKNEHEEGGIRYLARAVSDNYVVLISAQDMSPDEDEESTELSEYALQVHDTTIFQYYANGYRTTENTSLTESSYGGKSGWLSFFEVLLPDGDSAEFLMGYMEFLFEVDTDIYSIEIEMRQQTDKATAQKMFEWIKAG